MKQTLCARAACALLAAFWGVAPAAPLRGEDLAVSDLLDEAIWWPGDYGQVCLGDLSLGPFSAPHLPTYGPSVAQDYFLSKDTTARLKARRDEVVAEIVKRLKALDWEHVPAPGKLPKRIAQLRDKGLKELQEGDAGPGPWRPQSTRSLGGAMLSVIDTLDAVETFPELLRLEEQLNGINEKAVGATRDAQGQKKPPAFKLPPLELGGRTPGWDGMDYDTDDPEKSKWAGWRSDVFDRLVFQREILSVCLGLMERKGAAPPADSLVGRLHQLGLRRNGLVIADWSALKTKDDFIKRKETEGLRWDDALGVPLHDHEQVNLPWTAEVRENARALISAFATGGAPPAAPDAAALLADSIKSPGGWSQMCALPGPLPLAVPLSPDGEVASHYFFFERSRLVTLQAYRAKVVPALVEGLRKVDPAKSVQETALRQAGPGTGQSADTLGPLVLEVARTLNAAEALPELLRIEAALHALIARAEKDAEFTPPALRTDTPVGFTGGPDYDAKDPKAEAAYGSAAALFSVRIMHREVLGTIWKILIQERFAPAFQAKVDEAFLSAGDKVIRARLAKVRSMDDLSRVVPHYEQAWNLWDAEKKEVRISEDTLQAIGPRASVPYTEEARDEMCRVAGEFVRTVKPEQFRGADGMEMYWLPPVPQGL